jgi:hypothetical protein
MASLQTPQTTLLTTQLPFATKTVPPGLRWSLKLSDAATAKHYFIRVGGKSVTKRYISGAARLWNKVNAPEESRSIYSVETRLTGTPENVAQALRFADISEENINLYLASAISKQNHTTGIQADYYAKELADHEQCKKSTKGTCSGSPLELDALAYLVKHLQEARCVTKSGNKTCPPLKKGKTGPTKTLKQRVADLAPDAALDVSNMDSFTGKGVAKTKKRDQPKSGKFLAGELPIISNNAEKYVEALKLVYGDIATTRYAREIEYLRSQLSKRSENFSKIAPPLTTGGVPASFVAFTKAPTPQRLNNVAPAPIISSRMPPSLASPGRVQTRAPLGGPAPMSSFRQ